MLLSITEIARLDYYYRSMSKIAIYELNVESVVNESNFNGKIVG